MKRQQGYSLIEVLIAMALLGTVLMLIMGLFLYGRRNVYSGKQMTHAVALANNVLEDLLQVDKSQLISAFVLTQAEIDTVNFLGESYENTILRDTDTITAATQSATITFLTRWNQMITNRQTMANGKVTILITPTHDEDTAVDPATLAGATVLRLRVFVTWQEKFRERHVVVEGVKISR